MRKNNRGWIRVIEAFLAILLIMGASLLILNQRYFEDTDISSKVYGIQLSILREIQMDDVLREEILVAGNPPIYWEDQAFPQGIEEKMASRTPGYLICEAQICDLENLCVLNKTITKDVYTQSTSISATLELYDPRQLKIFCWED